MYLYGIYINDNRKVSYETLKIKGLGQRNKEKIFQEIGISKNIWVNELSDSQLLKICKIIDWSCLINENLKKENQININWLKGIKSYWGNRHHRRLPLWGQRTHSNGKTQKRLSR